MCERYFLIYDSILSLTYRPVASAGAAGAPAPAPEIAAPAPNLSPSTINSVAPQFSLFAYSRSKKLQPPYGRNPGYGAEFFTQYVIVGVISFSKFGKCFLTFRFELFSLPLHFQPIPQHIEPSH